MAKAIKEEVQEETSVKAKSERVFLNADKVRRAEDIYLIITGKRPKDTNISREHLEHVSYRFPELLTEKGIDLKKDSKEDVVSAIYKLLGGATRSREVQEKIIERAKKNKIGSSSAKEAMEKDEDNDGDDEDESDDE